MLTDGGTKPAVDNRFIRGLSSGGEALFVPGCSLADRRLLVSANPSHPKDVREEAYGGTKPAVDNWFIRGLSAGREPLYAFCQLTRKNEKCRTDAYLYL